MSGYPELIRVVYSMLMKKRRSELEIKRTSLTRILDFEDVFSAEYLDCAHQNGAWVLTLSLRD